MNKILIKNNIRQQGGVVLLEALIALVLFSMGILALVGLQATMIKNTSDSKYRADATFIAQNRIASMWGDLSNLSAYNEPAPGTSIATLLPNATRTTTIAARGLATVTVQWQAPGSSDVHQYVVTTYIGAL